MTAACELLCRLIDGDDPPFVGREEFDGALREAMAAWQAAGFLAREPGANPAPGCTCGEGVPYRVRGRLVCNACRAEVDPRELCAWHLDRDAFFRWLAGQMRLRWEVRRLDARVWQLGTWDGEGGTRECFYLRGEPVSDSGRARLQAYREVLVLCGLTRPAAAGRVSGRSLSLLEVVRADGPVIGIADLCQLFRTRGNVRFDAHSGVLWAGDAWLGEVPLGSREYHFLACLGRRLDHFVPYSDIKRDVLRAAGGDDATEEATFCQGLKSRIKKKWVPKIDVLVATTNKAEGYRLRGYAEL